jgi:hypothetical protein
MDLRDRGTHIGGQRIGHGLNRDRCVTAYGHRSDMDLATFATVNFTVRA